MSNFNTENTDFKAALAYLLSHTLNMVV
ncbi:hypothetical protein JL09_g4841 [Pichia kudriavzevii]|uniref:Uncharacterized protein n=1 Tax=Pichia kudriavzevii TaxID=4909 RepID=A0A099NVL6_PICKU|nr:hypothetical protein JL09_g4841 [Pichia kudriavzevii]